MIQQHYKRRQYLVDKRLQGLFAFRLYIVLIVSAVAITLMMSAFTSDSITMLYTDNDLQINQTPILILKRMFLANWIIIAPIGILLVFIAILISHRIAGPIYKIDSILNSMNNNLIGQAVHLREHDNFKNVASKLTTFNITLAENIKKIKSISGKLATTTDDSSQSPEKRLEYVQQLGHELKAIADFYTVVDE